MFKKMREQLIMAWFMVAWVEFLLFIEKVEQDKPYLAALWLFNICLSLAFAHRFYQLEDPSRE